MQTGASLLLKHEGSKLSIELVTSAKLVQSNSAVDIYTGYTASVPVHFVFDNMLFEDVGGKLLYADSLFANKLVITQTALDHPTVPTQDMPCFG